MRFKLLLIATAAFCLMGPPTSAQITDSGLGEVDPWGMGFLDAGEGALPTNMWRASRADDILTPIRRVRTRGLTPAERTMMRRLVLSPAARPTGEKSGELLAERARVMYELGEAEAAAALMTRLDEPPRGLNPEEIATDLNLALGNEASACSNLLYTIREGDYWMKLRAVCAALQGNLSGAELAMEVAQQQGVNDSWLFSAVAATGGDFPNPPPARFDSGVALALSAKAELKPPLNAVSRARPDLAAAMATRRSLPPKLRADAATVAAEAGLLDVRAHRAAFEDLLKEPGFKASGTIEEALAKTKTPAGFRPNPADHSAAIASALRSASVTPARFTATARLLKQDIDRLPRNSQTAKEALILAKASLAAGDARGAGRWSGATMYEGGPQSDAFELAYIDGLIILAGADNSPASASAIMKRLLDEAKSSEQKARTAQMLSMLSAFGTTLPSEARALVRRELSDSSSIKSGELVSLTSAARSGAAGEVILAIVGMTNGDPARIAPNDMIIIIDALKRIRAEDMARELALESTAYWKTPR